MKSNRRRVARNDTVKVLTCEAGNNISPRSRRQHKAWGASPRTESKEKISSPRSGRQRVVISLCRPLRGLARQFAGEQMRQGLKPCDAASEADEKPTRFLVEM